MHPGLETVMMTQLLEITSYYSRTWSLKGHADQVHLRAN